MSIKITLRLWLLISMLLAFESLALNFIPELSLIGLLQSYFPALQGPLSPRPGGMVSLWYGWTGFSLMLLTNAYALRKKWAPLRNLGGMQGWLNFHIFCGLMGPTFILFHTNFKVGGLVAISFWCMVVSFFSGIVGRYFFVQSGRQHSELERDLKLMHEALAKYVASSRAATAETMEQLKGRAVVLAGAQAFGGEGWLAIPNAVMSSMIGDLRLRFGLKALTEGLHPSVRESLHGFAVTRRRMLYLEQFRKVMGYWHSFHTPFAVFMYIVAVIHIVVALLFKVSQST